MRALGRSGDAIILLLLNHGSDLEIKNKEGNTALQIAIRYLGRIDVIQELLNRGALISEAVLETAQQLPDDGYKKSVLQILQEKQENPGKIFGKDCLYKKL
jgi:ankyrin repeat protein